MSSFHELQDQFLLSYENGTIDDNEFSALQEEYMSKNLDFAYEKHNRVLLEGMNNNPNFRPDIIENDFHRIIFCPKT